MRSTACPGYAPSCVKRGTGHVGHPQAVGAIGVELAIDQIRGRSLSGVSLCSHPKPRRRLTPRMQAFCIRRATRLRLTTSPPGRVSYTWPW